MTNIIIVYVVHQCHGVSNSAASDTSTLQADGYGLVAGERDDDYNGVRSAPMSWRN